MSIEILCKRDDVKPFTFMAREFSLKSLLPPNIKPTTKNNIHELRSQIEDGKVIGQEVTVSAIGYLNLNKAHIMIGFRDGRTASFIGSLSHYQHDEKYSLVYL